MRLLHARDMAFKEFIGRDIPAYAIVSHRWTDEEVTHQDFNDHRESFLNGERHGYGWIKIAEACKIATEQRLAWIWLDTCCVDKRSSAELSEAINSMFQWYRGSAVCYAFLPDVHWSPAAIETWTLDPRFISMFKRSVWFTRAWTLQELLAPLSVEFYDSHFDYIGRKSNPGITALVSEATGIECHYLTHRRTIFETSIAQRFSWAVERKATREEDIAYSLIGIAQINMPLLYGEGRRAFSRLQGEIIERSDDESIFACGPGPMLATSIQSFTHPSGPSHPITRGLTRVSSSSLAVEWRFQRSDYDVTNKGIKFSLPIPEGLRHDLLTSKSVKAAMPLCCTRTYTTVGVETQETATLVINIRPYPWGPDCRRLFATRVGHLEWIHPSAVSIDDDTGEYHVTFTHYDYVGGEMIDRRETLPVVGTDVPSAADMTVYFTTPMS